MHGELHVGHIFLNTSGFVKVGGLMVSELRRARDGALGVATQEMGSMSMNISGKEQTSAVSSPGDEAVALRQEEEGKDELFRHQTLYPPAHQRSVSRPMATPLQRALLTPPAPAPTASRLQDPPWLPPESTIGYNDTPEADVWAFGVILLQLCSGALTLPELQRLADDVCARERCEVIGTPRQVEKEHGVPDDIARIVAMCLKREPALRPSIDELISMSFISGEDIGAESWPQEGEMELRRRRFSQWMRGCARWTRGEVNKQ
jgi:serine/threonine protein kinase